MVLIENLDATVPEFADELQTSRVHLHVVRITHFAATRPRFPVRPDKFSIRRKDFNPVIARISHVEPVLKIGPQTFGAIKLALAVPAAADDTDQFSAGAKLLHP